MRKGYLLLLLFLVIAFSMHAQDSIKHWKTNGMAALNFNQLSLTNWAAGGSSSVSGTALFNFAATYTKEKNAWENTLNLTYGQLKRNGEKPVKSDDKIEFASKFGRKATSTFFYTLLFGFRSQFAPGYKSPQDKEVISNFLSPAYINLAIGIDYKPAEGFSFYLSPVSGRITIVNDDSLSAKGAFGVEPGKKARYEFGGYFKAAANKNIMENVNLQTAVDLFSNYIKHPENIDINWQVLLNMKINKYLSANISTQLIYDDDIKIGKDENKDGAISELEKKPRIQFKEALAIGLAYKF